MEWSAAQIERVRELAKAGYHRLAIVGEMAIPARDIDTLASAQGIRIKGALRQGALPRRLHASGENWNYVDAEDLPDAG